MDTLMKLEFLKIIKDIVLGLATVSVPLLIWWLNKKIDKVAHQTDGKITELIEVHKQASFREGQKEGEITGKNEGMILGNLQGKVDILVTGSPSPIDPSKKPTIPEGGVIKGEIQGNVKIKPE